MTILKTGTVVQDCARICHEANRALCLAYNDHSQRTWENAEEWQRESAIVGVQTVIEAAPYITEGMLHEAWCEHKRAEGWVYGENKDAAAKTHPCLVPMHELPPHQQAKDRVFLAIVMTYFGIDASL